MTRARLRALPPWLAWPTQVPQYDVPQNPHRGRPGLHYWRVPGELLPSEASTVTIECLLHYGQDGRLDGILNYFPFGTPFDRPGDVMVLVDPARRRQGIASALVREAARRWPGIDWTDQQLTDDGARLRVDLPDTP